MARTDRGHGVDGIIVLAKPPGPTSHDIVAAVRRLTGTRRVGHGGTLDPFASGVLPIFLGLATRIVEYHMTDGKAYRATICFGAGSTTDDRDGELVPGGGPPPGRAEVETALEAFRGEIEQRPPAYSALKVGGRRAYQLAREGNAPELALRHVTISRLDLVEWQDDDPERPVAIVDVECSAGTYIRALARDLGERLGCGAYLGALVRTASGPFRLKNAHALDDLRSAAAAGPSKLARLVLPIDTGLEAIPAVTLTEAELEAVARGQQVRPARRPPLPQGTRIRLLGPEQSLAGMGSWRAGRIVPEKIFVAPPPRAPRDAAAAGAGSDASDAGAGSADAPSAQDDGRTAGVALLDGARGEDDLVPERAAEPARVAVAAAEAPGLGSAAGPGSSSGISSASGASSATGSGSAFRAGSAAGAGSASGSGSASRTGSTSGPRQNAREPRLRMSLPDECIVTVPGIEALEADLGRLYLAVGVFDGLHRGHLYLLRHLRRAARRAGARPAVITFDAHPEEIVRGVAPALLCDPGERLVRLAAAGVEVTVVQHFDAALRATAYDRFVEMIRERVDVAGFLMTPDAAFGYERRGTPEALAGLGKRDGFEVTVVPPLLLDEEPVRSSEIRRDVAEGRLRAVRRRLGRPLSVTGRIAGPETDGRVEEAGGGSEDGDGGAGDDGARGEGAPRGDGRTPGDGRAREGRAREGREVRFELPAALPPPGHYPVLVGPPWSPGLDPVPASRSAWATVADGRLALDPVGGDDAFEVGVGVRLVFGLGQPVGEAARAAREPAS